MAEETTYGEFKSHTKDFLKQLVTKPSTAKIDDFLSQRLAKLGVSQGDFVKKLIDLGIIEKKSKVDDGLNGDGNGEPTFSISYKIPADRFEYKMKKLYIPMFQRNVPGEELSEATACGGNGGNGTGQYQYIQPLGKPIRRKVYMTEEQINCLMNGLDEATATSNAGNYQYDVPFPVDSDDPAMKHNKGKEPGSAENAIGMDRLTEEGGYDMGTPEGREGSRKWMNSMMSQEDPTGGYADQWVSNNAPDYPDISWDDCYEHMKRAFIAGVEYGRENV